VRSVDSPSLARLQRLLYLIPAAAREGGVGLDEVARALEVDRSTVLGDVADLTHRAYYLRAGEAANLSIELEGGRVRIWNAGPFVRPPRLAPLELLALFLGVRSRVFLRAEPPPREEEELSRRLQRSLGGNPERVPGSLPLEDASAREVDAELRDRTLDAIDRDRRVRLRYLKPGAGEVEARLMEPWAVVHGEGNWYLLGRDPAAEGRRAFRLDRVLSLEITDESFDSPGELDVSGLFPGRRVFLSDEGAGAETTPVTVVYSPRIARWLQERYQGETLADGSFRVTHQVADREWLVRHVLQYAGEARAQGEAARWVREVLQPED